MINLNVYKSYLNYLNFSLIFPPLILKTFFSLLIFINLTLRGRDGWFACFSVAVCPRSSDPIYIVSCYIRQVTASWTESIKDKLISMYINLTSRLKGMPAQMDRVCIYKLAWWLKYFSCLFIWVKSNDSLDYYGNFSRFFGLG